MILFCFCSRTAAPNRLFTTASLVLGQPSDSIGQEGLSFTYTCYRLRFRVVGILARNCKKLKAEFRADTKPLSSREEFRARRKRIRFDTKVGIQGLFYPFRAITGPVRDSEFSDTPGCCTESPSAPEGVPGSAMIPKRVAGKGQTTSTNLCFYGHS